MTTQNYYYALWYQFIDSEISALAISKDKLSLYTLHEKSILNKELLYDTYKKNIFQIIVSPIMCYKYNSISKKIEILNDSMNLCNGAFYALNNYPFNNNILKEVLIYLSKEEHNIWRELSNDNKPVNLEDCEYPKFFYEELVSLNVIEPDVYYDEGIMNA